MAGHTSPLYIVGGSARVALLAPLPSRSSARGGGVFFPLSLPLLGISLNPRGVDQPGP
jgi:hypothetical protein